MKVGILSDTHGRPLPLARLEEAFRDVEAICFLGDGARDMRQMEKTGRALYLVRGNMDAPHDAPDHLVLTLAGTTLLLAHGHESMVSYSTDRLLWRAISLRADVVLYGHTHQYSAVKREGVWLINPGSATTPRVTPRATAALLTLDSGESSVERIEL